MKWLSRFKFSLPPLPTPPPAHAPQRSTLVQLGLLVGIAAIAHFLLGHPVIAGYGMTIWLMKLAAVARVRSQPPRWLVMLLTIASFVLVLLFYGGWNGQKAGISFLVLLACLKFLESLSLRDYYMVCLILLFLASSSFLFNASLLNIAIVLIYTMAIIALMLRLSDPSDEARASRFRTASVIMLKALPLAVLLFFLFPRIHGDFGFIPSQDEFDGDNQLDNSLVAGDFVNSAFSNEPAFRVEFDGPVPRKDRLYWRAKVMQDERNFAWQVSKPDTLALTSARRIPKRDASEFRTIRYQVIHEPSDDDFLPYLDYALNPETGIQLPDSSVYRFEKENGIFSYTGQASQQPNLAEPGAADQTRNRAALTTTTSTPSARVQTLLAQWRELSDNPFAQINAVMNFMRSNGFEYTLTPPPLGSDPVDQFLFETRSGYCEHYASAFTIIMRWLDIPARIVVGYQGGSWNQVGEYLQIRYSDAHAWSEVWINNRWVRIDPTTAATLGEARISQGMEALLSLWEGSGFRPDAALADFLNPSGYQKALRRLREVWDNVGYQWNKWVVNYDFEAQKELLSSLGLEHRDSLYTLLGLLGAGTFCLILFYFWQLVPKPVKLAEPQRVYLKFLRRLKPFNLVKHPAETPTEFAQRARHSLPDHSHQIEKITAHYVQLRYGRGSADLAELNALIQQFKPRKPATNV